MLWRAPRAHLARLPECRASAPPPSTGRDALGAQPFIQPAQPPVALVTPLADAPTDGGAYRAVRLAQVTAVGKAAMRRQRLDLEEPRSESFRRSMAGAKSRTPGESMISPPPGTSYNRVAVVVWRPSSSRISCPIGASLPGTSWREQRRFPHARLADQHCRLARQQRRELGQRPGAAPRPAGSDSLRQRSRKARARCRVRLPAQTCSVPLAALSPAHCAAHR